MMSPASTRLLDGKVAVVTGAAGGLGRSFAVGLATKGAKIACLDIAQEGLYGTENEIVSTGGNAISVVADVREEGSVHKAFAKVMEHFGAVDILVNNAGIATTPMRLHEIPLVDWDRLMAVNLRGAFICLREALPLMQKNEHGGSIVNIASIAGMRGYFPGFSILGSNYSASKGGLIALTRQVAIEYAGENIRCNAIAPGFIENTDIGRERRKDASMKAMSEFEREMSVRVPMGRRGIPSELVELAVYLSSEMSSYITGQVIAADGGWTAA
jgi:NAD(P)-dependent dehydrogenase (short-subunit alcohol dehydrogenase family)